MASKRTTRRIALGFAVVLMCGLIWLLWRQYNRAPHVVPIVWMGAAFALLAAAIIVHVIEDRKE